MPNNPAAEAIKAEGNAFFKGGQYADAIAKYKEATAIDDMVPSYWSNMAACHEKLFEFEEMADAGRACVKADKNFVKGYFRLAVAYKQLNNLSESMKRTFGPVLEPCWLRPSTWPISTVLVRPVAVELV